MPSVPHVVACPIRWADLDLLGHVNNVTYLSYLADARRDLLRAVDLGPVEIREHRVTYAAPLSFRVGKVHVEIDVTSLAPDRVALASVVYDDAQSRTDHVRAVSQLVPVTATGRPRRFTPAEQARLHVLLDQRELRPLAWADPRREERGHWPVAVRGTDLAGDRVSDLAIFEYFQEARIRLMGNLSQGLGREERVNRSVVAQTDVEFCQPMPWRAQPYDAWTWLSALGRTSFTMESEISDGAAPFARARVVMVAWDPESDRSREFPPAHRAVLEAALG